MLLWRKLRPTSVELSWLCWGCGTLRVLSHTYLIFIGSGKPFFIYCALGLQRSLWLCSRWSLLSYSLSYFKVISREGKNCCLYQAIIYLNSNFLTCAFQNIQRSKEHSVMNFFHLPSPTSIFTNIFSNLVHLYPLSFFPTQSLKGNSNQHIALPENIYVQSPRSF